MKSSSQKYPNVIKNKGSTPICKASQVGFHPAFPTTDGKTTISTDDQLQLSYQRIFYNGFTTTELIDLDAISDRELKPRIWIIQSRFFWTARAGRRREVLYIR